jgi:glutathione S-transferase
MTTYKLTYFDFDGGRGEPIRIALHSAGIAFEDHRLTFPQFTEQRLGFRFHALPVFEVDGVAVTQSNAICRYVGKLSDLYPADDLQALYCDEVMDALEDLGQRLGPTFGMKGEELRLAREKLAEGWIPVFLRGLEQLLERGGGTWFADKRLTMADLKAFVNIRWLMSGALDHIPADLVQQHAPGLVRHEGRVGEDARVAAYYAARS